MITILVVVSAILGLAFMPGCESSAQTDALIGTGIGAVAGQAIGGDTEGTLIGAGVGAAGGYIIGNEQDKKKERAQTQTNNLRQETNTVTVNITNSNGSVTPVTLRKQGVGYLGPKGEYYSSLPTEEQLRQAGYGL